MFSDNTATRRNTSILSKSKPNRIPFVIVAANKSSTTTELFETQAHSIPYANKKTLLFFA